MLISRNWLQSYFETELPSAETIAETLMKHSFELEGIQSVSGDDIIDIDVLPNRAHDCLSYQGVAREYSVLTGLDMILDRYSYNESVSYNKEVIDVKIHNQHQCYRYLARTFSGVIIEDSPLWLQKRMESIGQRSINNIVDATNYVMFDTGNPVHAFDADKISGGITIRNAVENETMKILGDKEIQLETDDIVVADNEGVLALAGIKGGAKAEVTKDTKNIVIEVANFNPTTVRSTSRRIKILTDSSKRFENHISSEIAPIAMESISQLISYIVHTKSIGIVCDIYPKKEEEHIVNLEHEYINHILGTSIEVTDVENILAQMKYRYTREAFNYTIHIPANRLDIRVPVDMVEEIGRIYGYHNIPIKNLDEFIFEPQLNKEVYVENKLKNLLTEKGFSELKNYSFVENGDVQLLNPLSSDKSTLRRNLYKQMLDALEKNSSNLDFFGFDQIAIFEIGRVYTAEKEFDICCIAVANKDKKASKKYGTEREQLESLVAEINTLFGVTLHTEYKDNSVSFDITECSQKEHNYKEYFDNHTSYEESSRFHTISAFPYSTRDISFWTPYGTSKESLINTIKNANTDHLKKIFMFDEFKKEERVSYGFSLIFQSNSMTLTDDDVAGDMLLIENMLSSNGYEIR